MSTDFYERKMHWSVFGAPQPTGISGTPFVEDFQFLNTSEMGSIPNDVSAASIADVVSRIETALDSKVGEFDEVIVARDIETWLTNSALGDFYDRLCADACKAYRSQIRTCSYRLLNGPNASGFQAQSSANKSSRRAHRQMFGRARIAIESDHFVMVQLFLYDDDTNFSIRHLNYILTEGMRIANGRRLMVIYSPIYTAEARSDLVGTWVGDSLDEEMNTRILHFGADVAVWGQISGNTAAWQSYVNRYTGWKIPSRALAYDEIADGNPLIRTGNTIAGAPVVGAAARTRAHGAFR